MHRTRSISALVGTLALLSGALTAPHVATAGGLVGTGSVGLCDFTGKQKLKPPFLIGGTSTPVTTKLTGKLGAKTKLKVACSGGSGDGAHVIGGTLKAVNTSAAPNDCLGLVSVGLPSFTVVIKWKVAKGTPKLAPTTWNVAATPPANVNLSGPNGAIQFTLTGTGAATDVKGKPQSFAGSTMVGIGTTDETLTDFVTACTPPASGMKAFNFTGVNGPSTFQM